MAIPLMAHHTLNGDSIPVMKTASIGSAKHHGFSYIGLLIIIAIAGVVLAQVGVNWSQVGQREREHDLLFIGDQYRKAIALYYQRTPGLVKNYPKALDDLISDSRFNPPQHYLRQPYRDPITNQNTWSLIPSPSGGIMGVHSKSSSTPVKTSGFSQIDAAFEGAASYADWKFVYQPPTEILRR